MLAREDLKRNLTFNPRDFLSFRNLVSLSFIAKGDKQLEARAPAITVVRERAIRSQYKGTLCILNLLLNCFKNWTLPKSRV